MKKPENLTDWARVKAIRDGDPIPYDPEDGPYDPNDEAATEEFFRNAIIIRPGQRGAREFEVVQHLRREGPGWQTRIDETLKKAVGK